MQKTYSFITDPRTGRGGRQGSFIVRDAEGNETVRLTTPYVFPVINVIGGPAGPGRNGGLWRPIKWWMFLHPPRIQAYLCQVLHAIDFNLNKKQWDTWLSKPFHQWITDWQAQVRTDYTPPKSALRRPDNGYPFRAWMEHWPFWKEEPGDKPVVAPFTFLDSGGFALMKLANFKKAEALGVEETPAFIFSLQRQQGGDLVASLDRPVPPGLPAEEVRSRQEWSITNALAMLNLLAEERLGPVHPQQPFTPFPYVAVHGDTLESGKWYVEEFFRRWQTDEVRPEARQIPFGFAIGSMVPRADDPRLVVEIVWGMTEAIHAHHPVMEAAGLPVPPIHVFGINSHLTALLTYLGVDTFDSSTFADVAQRANYLKEDLRPVRISEVTYRMLEECACQICAGLLRARESHVLEQMKKILLMEDESRVQGESSPNQKPVKHELDDYYHEFVLPSFGVQKATRSDIYALLAMHNWSQLTKETAKVQQHAAEGTLAQHMVDMVVAQGAQRGERMTDALLWLAAAEAQAGRPQLLSTLPSELQEQAKQVNPAERRGKPASQPRVIWTSDMFRLEGENAYPERPPEKNILLLMACSKGKPYRDSPHQREIIDSLKAQFPADCSRIHKVTFSGLFGPVPEEFEDQEDNVVNKYDYKLEEGDEEQAKELRRRLESYLEKHSYDHLVAYIYFPAYRAVVEEVAQKYRIKVLPEHPKRGGKPSRYRTELLEYLEKELHLTRVKAQRVDKPKQLRLNLDL